MQCVSALLSGVLDGSGSGENTGKIIKDLPGTHQQNVQKEADNILPEHLAKVIHVLLQHIPFFLPIFQEEMLQKTSICLQKAEGLKKIPGIYLQNYLRIYVKHQVPDVSLNIKFHIIYGIEDLSEIRHIDNWFCNNIMNIILKQKL